MKETQTDKDEEPETVEPDGADDNDEHWIRRRRRRPLVRRVGGHVETRFSYGVLTLSTFGFEAAALLIVIAVVGPLVLLAQGRFLHALVFFVVALACAAVAGAFGFAAGFIGVPFAGDWFLEWPAHAIAWTIGLAGCALLAALVLLTPLPAYLGALLTVAAVFGAGYTLAYALRTTSPPKPQEREQKRR
jgi:hypothetical protein